MASSRTSSSEHEGSELDNFDAPPLLSGQIWKNVALLAFSVWAITLSAILAYSQYRATKHEDEDAQLRERLTIVEQRQAVVIKHMERLDLIDDRNGDEHRAIMDAIRKEVREALNEERMRERRGGR